VTCPQIRQQFLLVIVGNRVISAAAFNAGFTELRQQFADVNAKHFGQLGNGYFGHALLLRELLVLFAIK
jgi:hypothetical protein